MLSDKLREIILANLKMGDCWERFDAEAEECGRCMAAKECAKATKSAGRRTPEEQAEAKGVVEAIASAVAPEPPADAKKGKKKAKRSAKKKASSKSSKEESEVVVAEATFAADTFVDMVKEVASFVEEKTGTKGNAVQYLFKFNGQRLSIVKGILEDNRDDVEVTLGEVPEVGEEDARQKWTMKPITFVKANDFLRDIGVTT